MAAEINQWPSILRGLGFLVLADHMTSCVLPDAPHRVRSARQLERIGFELTPLRCSFLRRVA